MKKRRGFRLAAGHFMVAAAVLLLGTFFAVVGSFTSHGTASSSCANAVSCIKDLTGKFEATQTGTFMGKQINSPSESTDNTSGQAVLGDQAGVGKHIYIDLTHQMLYAYEGDHLIYSFLVSTGKWAYTPTGDFHIWIKLRYTRMVGGNPAIGTYYNLPNVPYTMYLYNDEHPKTQGYGIHGAYWHNNFGHPMSHGCINMRIADSEQLYAWASPSTTSTVTYASDSDPGTPVTIYGQTPKE